MTRKYLTLDQCRALSAPLSVGPFVRRTKEEMAGVMYAMFGPVRKGVGL